MGESSPRVAWKMLSTELPGWVAEEMEMFCPDRLHWGTRLSKFTAHALDQQHGEQAGSRQEKGLDSTST